GTAVVAVAVGTFIYFSPRGPQPPPPEKPVVAPPVAEEPPIQHPIAAAPATEPLPPLDQSDAKLLSALADLIGKQPVERFIVPDSLVRHFVVTVDNLTATKAAERLRPVKPASGSFVTAGPESSVTLDPSNYQRYASMVELFRSVDEDKLIAL